MEIKIVYVNNLIFIKDFEGFFINIDILNNCEKRLY